MEVISFKRDKAPVEKKNLLSRNVFKNSAVDLALNSPNSPYSWESAGFAGQTIKIHK